MSSRAVTQTCMTASYSSFLVTSLNKPVSCTNFGHHLLSLEPVFEKGQISTTSQNSSCNKLPAVVIYQLTNPQQIIININCPQIASVTWGSLPQLISIPRGHGQLVLLFPNLCNHGHSHPCEGAQIYIHSLSEWCIGFLSIYNDTFINVWRLQYWSEALGTDQRSNYSHPKTPSGL